MLEDLRNNIYGEPQRSEETAEQVKERQERETDEAIKMLQDMGANGLKKN